MADHGSSHRLGGRVSDRLVKALEILCGLLVAMIVLLVFTQVLARYVLNASMAWNEEATRLLFIYVIFFGFVVAVRTGRNLHVEVLVDCLPAGPRRWLRILVHGVMAVFLAVVTWQGTLMAQHVAAQRTPALQISKAFFYLPIPAASLLLLGYLGARIIALCQER